MRGLGPQRVKAFTVSFTGTKSESEVKVINIVSSLYNPKRPSLTPKKQLHTIIPPPPNLTLGTMQSYKYHSPAICQTLICPSDWQMEKHDSSHHCTLFIALGDARLGCSCMAMETHSIKLSTHYS